MKKVLIIVLSFLFYFGCSYGDGYLGSTIPMDGLAAWYAADEKVSKDIGNNVFAWGDISGNGYDLSAPGGNPLWIDNQVNGKPIIQSLGVGYLGSNIGPIIKNNKLTLIIVWRPIGVHYLISSNSSFGINLIVGTPYAVEFHPGLPSVLDFFLIDTSQNVYSFKYSGDTATIYINKQKINDVSQINSFDFSTGFKIGSAPGGGSLGNIEFAEVIIYNTDLDNDAREEVEDYLMEKYAI